MEKRRPRIGLLTATITDGFSSNIARGAMKAAEKYDCDLFIFPGKYIGLERMYIQLDARYEYQYNVLFDHAAASGLDYLIVALGTIAYAVDDGRKLAFMERFGDTPTLSVASVIGGTDYLIFDNKNGIREMMEHLIGEGRKRIGFLAGDLNSSDARERYEAYREALEASDIGYDEKLVAECDISGARNEEIQAFLSRVPDLDALVCVNDAIARAAYPCIREIGKRVGADIAVVGFDDNPYTAELEPPLASIMADAQLLGEKAVEKAMKFISGEPDDEHYVPTRFILRQSASVLGGLFHSPETVFVGSREDVLRNMRTFLKMENLFSVKVIEDIMAMTTRIIDVTEKLIGSDKRDQDLMIDAFDTADGFFIGNYFSVDNMIKSYSLIDGAYKWFLDRCPAENLPQLRRVYEYFYRRVSIEIAQEYRRLQESHNKRTHLDNLFIRDTLMFNEGAGLNYSKVLKRLSDIGADTAYLYLLEKPVPAFSGERFNSDTDWYFKAYSYGSDTYSMPEWEQKISIKQVFENDRLPYGRRYTLVAADLYSNEFQYGMALIEPKNADFFDELELTVYQISSAVRTLGLLRKQEDMLAELHSRNLALDSLSKIDELTGLNNRRGFYVEAEKLVAENAGKKLIVCYADMDNLKMVNDGFGHLEGDYSIKLLADCMRYVFGERAVTGRMGGDEFAAIVPAECCGEPEELQIIKDSFLAEAASRDKKPFKVDISLGICKCVCTDSYDLRSAIDNADGLLYGEKTKRRKEI